MRLRLAVCGAVTSLLIATGASAAPRVATVTPPPSEWIVDGRATLEVTLIFDAEVIVPPGGITVQTRTLGVVSDAVVTPLDVLTDTVTVTTNAVNADVVTIIANVAIADADGTSINGDGDGLDTPGPAVVLEYRILQGDVTRDGVVDVADMDAYFAALAEYDPRADLDGNGVIDTGDAHIIADPPDRDMEIAATDGDAPTAVSAVPEYAFDVDPVVRVTFDEAMDPATLDQYTVYAVRADDSLILANDAPTTDDSIVFEYRFTDLTCGDQLQIIVDRSAADPSGARRGNAQGFRVPGEDKIAPSITCPEPVFVNSTTVYTLEAAAYGASEALMAFLDGAIVSDTCTPPAEINVTTSLDEPVDLPLGVNEVEFTAEDLAGNTASCTGTVIVVPAVPLQGDPGAEGPPGAQGTPGEDGTDGAACWDINENGIEDPIEDVNEDGVVNVLDCQGAQGPAGEPAPQEDPTGDPLPGDGGTGSTPSRVCGALGMLNLLWMFAGLCAMRAGRRRTLQP